MQTLKLVAFAALAVLFATLSPAASATDGVVLINQATVTNGLPGCGSSGFPIRVCQPGSYRLASNIVVSANLNVIEIAANNVTLDLNGFTISGSGANAYLVFSDTGTNAVTIENGTLDGAGGIGMGGSGIVDRLTIVNSSAVAVFVSGNGMVENCLILPAATASYAIYFAGLGAYGRNDLGNGVRGGTSMGTNVCGASVC